MSDFEKFDVSEWEDDGVIALPPAPRRRSTRRRKTPWMAVIVMAPALATGFSHESFRLAEHDMGVVVSTTIEPWFRDSVSVDRHADDAPPEFWAGVRDYIRSVPDVSPEPPMIDPDPLV
jgi:hypothetical protein